MNILVTGAAGFIGFHLSKRLLKEGYNVTGLDNINDYYDIDLKFGRLQELGIQKDQVLERTEATSSLYPSFSFRKLDLIQREEILNLFKEKNFDVVIHLAAQAGVRYSIVNPHAYTSSNIEGFLNILEGCRNNAAKHLIFASSSSVYGMNAKIPFNTSDQVDQPVSLYAATKKANELMAHTYAHLYKVPVTGLRFFTVYGPWGRPDMAYYKFAECIRKNQPIEVYNNGNMSRDFTYIDDIIEAIIRLTDKPPTQSVPYQLFNIGKGAPVNLLEFIQILEQEIGNHAKKVMLPMQPGDVEHTWADVSDLYEFINFSPQTTLKEGISKFANWFKNYNSCQKG